MKVFDLARKRDEAERQCLSEIDTTPVMCPDCKNPIPLNQLVVLNKDGPRGPIRCPRCHAVMPPPKP